MKYNYNYYDLKGVINSTIKNLEKLKTDLDLDRICKEKGLSEPEEQEIRMVMELMNEAETLYKMRKKINK